MSFKDESREAAVISSYMLWNWDSNLTPPRQQSSVAACRAEPRPPWMKTGLVSCLQHRRDNWGHGVSPYQLIQLLNLLLVVILYRYKHVEWTATQTSKASPTVILSSLQLQHVCENCIFLINLFVSFAHVIRAVSVKFFKWNISICFVFNIYKATNNNICKTSLLVSLYFRLKSCWIYSGSHCGICILVNKSVDSAAAGMLQVSVLYHSGQWSNYTKLLRGPRWRGKAPVG